MCSYQRHFMRHWNEELLYFDRNNDSSFEQGDNGYGATSPSLQSV